MTGADDSAASERATLFSRQLADADALAAELGSPAEWLASALTYLRERTEGHSDGSARVSIAAVRVVLAHIDNGGAA